MCITSEKACPLRECTSSGLIHETSYDGSVMDGKFEANVKKFN